LGINLDNPDGTRQYGDKFDMSMSHVQMIIAPNNTVYFCEETSVVNSVIKLSVNKSKLVKDIVHEEKDVFV